MAKSSGDDYEPISARRRVQMHQRGGSSNYLKVPEGMNFFKVDKVGIRFIDILPYRVKLKRKWVDPGKPHWECTYFRHRQIGPSRENVVCPSLTLGKPCPICDYRSELSGDPNTDKKLLDALRAQEMQLFLVIDLKDPDRGIQIWDFAFTKFGKILEDRVNGTEGDEDDEEFANWHKFADLREGYSLRVQFIEDTFGQTKYLTAGAIDFRPRKRGYKVGLLDEVPCLDDLLIIRPAKELDALLRQTGGSADDDEEEEDELPRGKARGRKPRDDDYAVDDVLAGEPAPWDREEADDEADDEGDDGEEDPAPAKRSAAKGKAAAGSKRSSGSKSKRDKEWDDDWKDE